MEVSPGELKTINTMSGKKLRPEEVYAPAARLHDNEIDRNNEWFLAATLEELASPLVGESGLFGYQWSTWNQTARIYRAEIVRENWMTETGKPYCYLKGRAYLLCTEGNRELIAIIEGGIKKEVSIGCVAERSMCSTCSEESRTCSHEKGTEYGDRRCRAKLAGATDAYERSFTAVPIQRNVGVMKHIRMEQKAALGQKCPENLRGGVARLGSLAGLGLERAALRGIADELSYDELLALKDVPEQQTKRVFLMEIQLRYGGGRENDGERGGALLI